PVQQFLGRGYAPLCPERGISLILPPLMQQVLHLPLRQREPDIEQLRKPDDLGARLEGAEGRAFGHAGRLRAALPRRKPVSSDSTLRRLSFGNRMGRDRSPKFRTLPCPG